MAKAAQKKNQLFNVDTFLATANGGRTIAKYRKGQTVFRQGDLADSVFYIQEGEVKVCVISEQGKEAVVALHQKGAVRRAHAPNCDARLCARIVSAR